MLFKKEVLNIILHSGSGVGGIALDPFHRWLYFTKAFSGGIYKVNLNNGDTSQVVNLYQPGEKAQPRDIVLDIGSK